MRSREAFDISLSWNRTFRPALYILEVGMEDIAANQSHRRTSSAHYKSLTNIPFHIAGRIGKGPMQRTTVKARAS